MSTIDLIDGIGLVTFHYSYETVEVGIKDTISISYY